MRLSLGSGFYIEFFLELNIASASLRVQQFLGGLYEFKSCLHEVLCLLDALPSSSLETPQSTPRFSEQQAASQPDSRQIQQPLPTSGQHHQSQNHQAPNHNGSRGHGIVSSTINQNSAPPPARIPTPPPARVSTPPPGGRGNALIPTDIPKMGGARPKQTGSVSPLQCRMFRHIVICANFLSFLQQFRGNFSRQSSSARKSSI